MRSTARVLAGLVVGLALIAAGCADDDDASTETDPGATEAAGAPPSRPEFIAEADAICRRYSRRLDRAAAEALQGQTSGQQIGRYITEEFAPATQRELDSIRALTPPEGDEERVDAILDAAEEAALAVEVDPSLFVSGSPFSDANRLAGEYGMKVCGQ